MAANVVCVPDRRQRLTPSLGFRHLLNVPSPTPAPLQGRRIVITRSEPDAQVLASRLRALGAVPLVVPAIRIEFADPAPLDSALARMQSYDWVIFTSRNAVEAVFRRTARISGPRVAAIGPATAAELRARSVEPHLVPAKHVAEGLMEELGDVTGLRFLLPRADIARPDLPDGLKARGGTVDDITVYRTAPAARVEQDLGLVDAVTFTSSSTVKNFVQGGPVPAGARIICIGPITARTARECGLNVTEIAGDYTEDGLVEALLSALRR